jgi:hypothetical protein
MTRETYSLILNSQNATNLTNINGQTQIQYYINWDSVLPYQNKDTPRSTYIMTWTLKSVNTATSLNQNAFVDIKFGQSNTFEQGSTSSKIGFIYPNAVQQTGASWTYFYQATAYDNLPTCISYPTSNLLTVTFQDFNSANAFAMIHYVLILNFQAVDEK